MNENPNKNDLCFRQVFPFEKNTGNLQGNSFHFNMDTFQLCSCYDFSQMKYIFQMPKDCKEARERMLYYATIHQEKILAMQE